MDAQSISLRAAASDSATSLWNSDSTGRSSVCTTFLRTRPTEHLSEPGGLLYAHGGNCAPNMARGGPVALVELGQLLRAGAVAAGPRRQFAHHGIDLGLQAAADVHHRSVDHEPVHPCADIATRTQTCAAQRNLAKLTVAECGVGLADEGCRRGIARCERRAPHRPEMHQQLWPQHVASSSPCD